MSEHTPGPWFRSTDESLTGARKWAAEYGCETLPDGDEDERRAFLIGWLGGRVQTLRMELAAARDAIAKARGKS